MTVRALADRAGVAFSTVHLIETGKLVPRVAVIRTLSDARGVHPGEVIEFAAAMAEIASGNATAAAPV